MSREIALAHEQLSSNIPPVELNRIKYWEEVLCIIFGKQFSLGSEKCFHLRKALIDLWTEARLTDKNGAS